jgi:hypothetical protein
MNMGRTYLLQLIARAQNDGRKEEVKEEGMLESLARRGQKLLWKTRVHTRHG